MLHGPLLATDLLFRGMAVGVLLVMGAALWFTAASRSARISGLLFALSGAAYALNSSELLRGMIGPGLGPVWLLSVAGVAYTWLFLSVLFEDRPLTWQAFLPAAVLTGVGFAGWLLPRAVQGPIWITHNLIEAALALHALNFIVASWRGDMVEARRRLRGPFLAAVTLYMVTLSAFEIAEALGWDGPWHRVAGAVSLALFCMAGAGAFLTARGNLFGAATPPAPSAPAPEGDAQDRAIAQRLETLMGAEEIWRREGLTIGALAEELKAPEHRVRRVINEVLGHRNFAAFINARRIEAARAALADPANAGRTVAAIAFDLGFGSLGPFNRAFKDATGQTPTEFRAGALK
jgi:AraC-like DNA-binding protein